MTRNDDEPHWGDPDRSQPRTDASPAERTAGIAWLTVGALFCLFLGVLYVGVTITVDGRRLPLPWVIPFTAFFMNAVSRTALLWTPKRSLAGVPVAVWIVGFLGIAAAPYVLAGAPIWLPSTLWTALLLIAGAAAGLWPLRPQFPATPGVVPQ